MKNTLFQNLLFTLFCATQISVNTCGMENKQLELLPEIQGKIVTTLLKLYLDELEDIMLEDYERACGGPFWDPVTIFNHIEFEYKDDTNLSLYKVFYWLHHAYLKPLQEYIDLNTTSKNGNTILHHTIKASLECTDSSDLHSSSDHYIQCDGNKDMFNLTRYLLEHNANPNVHNNFGESPFCIWTKSWFTYSYGDKYRRPIEASLIHLFLDHKADPNIASKNNSFIFTLVSGNYSQAVERILKNTNLKAIMNNKDENGDTLALWAATWFNLEFLQLLTEAGADFNITNSKGQTPLDIALQYQSCIVEKHGTEHAEKLINLLKDKTQKNDQ